MAHSEDVATSARISSNAIYKWEIFAIELPKVISLRIWQFCLIWVKKEEKEIILLIMLFIFS